MDDGKAQTNGDDTYIDIVFGYKAKRVSVSREAIEHHLRLSPDRAAKMSAAERRAFVETNFMLVVTAADRKLELSGVLADVIAIETGEL